MEIDIQKDIPYAIGGSGSVPPDDNGFYGLNDEIYIFTDKNKPGIKLGLVKGSSNDNYMFSVDGSKTEIVGWDESINIENSRSGSSIRNIATFMVSPEKMIYLLRNIQDVHKDGTYQLNLGRVVSPVYLTSYYGAQGYVKGSDVYELHLSDEQKEKTAQFKKLEDYFEKYGYLNVPFNSMDDLQKEDIEITKDNDILRSIIDSVPSLNTIDDNSEQVNNEFDVKSFLDSIDSKDENEIKVDDVEDKNSSYEEIKQMLSDLRESVIKFEEENQNIKPEASEYDIFKKKSNPFEEDMNKKIEPKASEYDSLFRNESNLNNLFENGDFDSDMNIDKDMKSFK